MTNENWQETFHKEVVKADQLMSDTKNLVATRLKESLDEAVKNVIRWPKLALTKAVLHSYLTYDLNRLRQNLAVQNVDHQISERVSDVTEIDRQLEAIDLLSNFLSVFCVTHYDGTPSYYNGLVLFKPSPEWSPIDHFRRLIIVTEKSRLLVDPMSSRVIEGMNSDPTIYSFYGVYDIAPLFDIRNEIHLRIQEALKIDFNRVQGAVDLVRQAGFAKRWSVYV